MVHIRFWFVLMMLMYIGTKKYTIKKNIEAFVVDNEETGLEVNVDKTNYMVISRERNAG